MKKILLALAVLSLAASSALAATGVAVNGTPYGGLYARCDRSDCDPGDYLLDSYSLT